MIYFGAYLCVCLLLLKEISIRWAIFTELCVCIYIYIYIYIYIFYMRERTISLPPGPQSKKNNKT